MTREEHLNILEFIDSAVRQDDAADPVDVEADAIIRALFVRNPDAAYRITMLAMAQRRELEQFHAEPAEPKHNFRAGWLTRLLKKQQTRDRHRRRDPRLSV